jgi:hypothetical protein
LLVCGWCGCFCPATAFALLFAPDGIVQPYPESINLLYLFSFKPKEIVQRDLRGGKKWY